MLPIAPVTGPISPISLGQVISRFACTRAVKRACARGQSRQITTPTLSTPDISATTPDRRAVQVPSASSQPVLAHVQWARPLAPHSSAQRASPAARACHASPDSSTGALRATGDRTDQLSVRRSPSVPRRCKASVPTRVGSAGRLPPAHRGHRLLRRAGRSARPAASRLVIEQRSRRAW